MYQTAQMPVAEGSNDVDSTDVFCTFKYYTHIIHKAKHWRYLLILPAPLSQHKKASNHHANLPLEKYSFTL